MNLIDFIEIYLRRETSGYVNTLLKISALLNSDNALLNSDIYFISVLCLFLNPSTNRWICLSLLAHRCYYRVVVNEGATRY